MRWLYALFITIFVFILVAFIAAKTEIRKPLFQNKPQNAINEGFDFTKVK